MKIFAIFLVTLTTASLLIFWTSDFNLYRVNRETGTKVLKDEADATTRAVFSLALGTAFSGLNTALIWLAIRCIAKRKPLGETT